MGGPYSVRFDLDVYSWTFIFHFWWLNLHFKNHKSGFHLWGLSGWTKCVSIINLCLPQSLFYAIIQIPTEQSFGHFVEGTRVMLTLFPNKKTHPCGSLFQNATEQDELYIEKTHKEEEKCSKLNWTKQLDLAWYRLCYIIYTVNVCSVASLWGFWLSKTNVV